MNSQQSPGYGNPSSRGMYGSSFGGGMSGSGGYGGSYIPGMRNAGNPFAPAGAPPVAGSTPGYGGSMTDLGAPKIWGDPGSSVGGPPPGVFGDSRVGMGGNAGPPPGVYGDPNLGATFAPPATMGGNPFQGLPPGSAPTLRPGDPRIAQLQARSAYNNFGPGVQGFNPAQLAQQYGTGQIDRNSLMNTVMQLDPAQRKQWAHEWGQYNMNNGSSGSSFDNQARARGWIK